MNSFNPGDKLPPNCDNESYYLDIGICHPDSLCKQIKNPVSYTLRRWKSYLRDLEENKKSEKKENKERAKESTKEPIDKSKNETKNEIEKKEDYV